MASAAQALFYRFRAVAEADVAMSLLRARDAVLHLALIAGHLGEGQIVDGPSLAAALEEDLYLLQGEVSPEAEDDQDEDLAGALLRRWTKRGWVHRTIDLGTGAERYQITSGAHQAVRQMKSLERPDSIATESAMSLVATELRQIATQANPDPQVRLRALDEQIAELTELRAQVESGQAPAVEPGELADRVAAVAQLVERMPGDIARYGEQLHANTAELLRQSLADDPGDFAESLARMFEGHNVLAESPQGQAFRAFATMVGVPSRREQLEGDIEEILANVPGLPEHLGELLREFIGATSRRVQEVEGIRAAAFRRINTFVSGGDAAHYRSMRSRVSAAQVAAVEAFRATYPGRDTRFAVPFGPFASASVGRIRLREGAVSAPRAVADTSAEFSIDPAALAGSESIDWNELRGAVHRALAAHGGYATLPEVLGELSEPRTGDVIAVWSLAARHGEVDPQAREAVWAHTARGPRQITTPYVVFTRALPKPVGPRGGRRSLRTQEMLMLEGEDV